jgi:hypothetical protein
MRSISWIKNTLVFQQHSSQQPSKAPSTSYTSSDRGGEETCKPAEVSIEEEDKAYFLDQEYSGLYNENV